MKRSNEGVCPVCNKETNWQSFDRGYLKHCSCKCTQADTTVKAKRENSCIRKYGVKNPYQASEIKDKIKSTNMQRYGVEYNLQRAETIQKARKTKAEKHGNETYNNTGKAKQTCLAKYGVDSYTKTEQFKQQLLQKLNFAEIARKGNQTRIRQVANMKQRGYITLQEALVKYGQSWYKNDIVPIIYKHHTGFISHADEKIIEAYYQNNNGHSSQEENQLLSILKKYYSGTIVHGDSKTIAPLELDFFLPDLHVAIEYNGIYWHSTKFKSKEYHYNKSMLCYQKGIRLVHFYEFEDWEYIEAFIKDMINQTEVVTNDFNKFSPLQLAATKVEFSGPQPLFNNIFGSGTFSV